tara:strand:+ start:1906 stop:2058 length:153 start_codon:yes stop_codon:yes gene_type:complete
MGDVVDLSLKYYKVIGMVYFFHFKTKGRIFYYPYGLNSQVLGFVYSIVVV